MAFNKQQADEIKKQLLEQVKNIPNKNKDQIIKHIESLNEQQLEEFLKQNNIQLSESGQPVQTASPESEKPIFESIIKGELPSFKIAENSKSIAILELNPLSKAHSIILPKEKTTIEKIPKSALTLAQKIAKKIKLKFKPEDIKIETFSFQDYPAINIIPIYKDKELKKYKAEGDELKKVQSRLETKKRGPRTTKKEIKTENLPEISFRIP